MAADLDTGPKKSVVPNVNVTPLVDVALVVLIIFMVVTPLAIRQLQIHLPVPSDQSSVDHERPLSLTLHVHAGGAMDLNGKALADDLDAEVAKNIGAAKGVLHVDADDGVPYGEVVDAVDQARRAGASSIAVVTHASD
jgi:biopolymer transport protein TolR